MSDRKGKFYGICECRSRTGCMDTKQVKSQNCSCEEVRDVTRTSKHLLMMDASTRGPHICCQKIALYRCQYSNDWDINAQRIISFYTNICGQTACFTSESVYFPYSNSCTSFIHFKNHQFTLMLKTLKNIFKTCPYMFRSIYIRSSSGGS
jgi:hypothetical protein